MDVIYRLGQAIVLRRHFEGDDLWSISTIRTVVDYISAGDKVIEALPGPVKYGYKTATGLGGMVHDDAGCVGYCAVSALPATAVAVRQCAVAVAAWPAGYAAVPARVRY